MLFLVFNLCSRRFGRAAPLVVVAFALDAVVGVVVGFCPGSVLGTLDGDAEGGRPPLMLVCTGGGGFLILVAIPAGLATTAAIVYKPTKILRFPPWGI